MDDQLTVIRQIAAELGRIADALEQMAAGRPAAIRGRTQPATAVALTYADRLTPEPSRAGDVGMIYVREARVREAFEGSSLVLDLYAVGRQYQKHPFLSVVEADWGDPVKVPPAWVEQLDLGFREKCQARAVYVVSDRQKSSGNPYLDLVALELDDGTLPPLTPGGPPVTSAAAQQQVPRPAPASRPKRAASSPPPPPGNGHEHVQPSHNAPADDRTAYWRNRGRITFKLRDVGMDKAALWELLVAMEREGAIAAEMDDDTVADRVKARVFGAPPADEGDAPAEPLDLGWAWWINHDIETVMAVAEVFGDDSDAGLKAAAQFLVRLELQKDLSRDQDEDERRETALLEAHAAQELEEANA